MDHRKKLGIIYLVFYILMILANYLTGSNVGNVADQNESFIQPAGYVFSIWGLIYILLFIWIIRIFFTHYQGVYERVNYWLVGNFVLNALWIFVFTQEWLLVSNIVIIGLLITLIVIYKKMTKVQGHWFDRFPFSIYLGWVSIATIVNIVTWVVGNGVEELFGLNEYQWTLVLLVIATALAVWLAVKHMDWVLPLVFVWAFSGIIVKNENDLMLLMVVTALGIVTQLATSLYVGAKVRKTV